MNIAELKEKRKRERILSAYANGSPRSEITRVFCFEAEFVRKVLEEAPPREEITPHTQRTLTTAAYNETMRVELAKLKANPSRDFQIDPVDQEAVTKIRESIHNYTFWGGVAARQRNGHIEVAAGWTRIQAAMKEGVTHADIAIADFTDHDMVLAYITENTTQRGNTTTALAGGVASAVRELAKAILTGTLRTLVPGLNQKAVEIIKGQLTGGKGIGRDLVERYLQGVAGMAHHVIEHQLVILKNSGHYDRIIKEVTDEVLAEQAKEAQELERLEAEAAQQKTLADKKKVEKQMEAEKFDTVRAARTTAKTAKREQVIFDYEGVSKYLKNDYQIKAFRQAAISAEFKNVLAVEKQTELARKIVRIASGRELTGDLIYQIMHEELLGEKQDLREATQAETDRLKVKDAHTEFKKLFDNFCTHARLVANDAFAIERLLRTFPEEEFRITQNWREMVGDMKKYVDRLSAGIEGGKDPKKMSYKLIEN